MQDGGQVLKNQDGSSDRLPCCAELFVNWLRLGDDMRRSLDVILLSGKSLMFCFWKNEFMMYNSLKIVGDECSFCLSVVNHKA